VLIGLQAARINIMTPAISKNRYAFIGFLPADDE